MMKSVLIVSVLVVMGQSQRPPYAGSANRYPQVLPRFQENQTTTSTTTTTTTVAPSTTTVVNRVGEDSTTGSPISVPTTSSSPAPTSSSPVPTSSSPVPTNTSTASPDAILYPSDNLPVLSLGDAELVERIKTWPREKQPWWYLNRVAIEQHLNPNPTANRGSFVADGSKPIATKPFYAG